MSLEKNQSRPISHLVHVSELPADSVAITSYGRNRFTNLFYSKGTGKLYQRYPKRIREIETANLEHGSTRKIYVRNADGHTVYISMKKLIKSIEEMPNDEEHPLEIVSTNGGSSEDETAAEAAAETAKRASPNALGKLSARRQKKEPQKIDFVKGEGKQNTQSQVGGIVNAQTALKEAKETKHKRWNTKKITLDDVVL